MSIVLVAAAVIGAMIGIKAGEESNKKNRQRRFEASKQEYKPLEQAQNINTQNNLSEPVIPVENYYTVDLFHGTPDKEKLFGNIKPAGICHRRWEQIRKRCVLDNTIQKSPGIVRSKWWYCKGQASVSVKPDCRLCRIVGFRQF